MALKPAFAVNRRILEEIMGTAEWRQLREAGSINDLMISAIATIGACERAIEALDPNSRSQINRLAAANEAAEKLFGQAVLNELASQATAQQVEDSANARRKRARTPGARSGPPRSLKNHSARTMTNEQGHTAGGAAGMAEALDEADAIQNAIAAFGGGYSTSNGGSGTPREMTRRRRSNSPCASCSPNSN